MKKLAGLVVILAALILGSYYGMGMVTERTLKKSIAMVDQSNGVFVEVAEYHRGLCRSTAVLNWRMQVPARIVTNQDGVAVTVPAQEYKIQVPLDIYHGPVMIVDSRPKFGLGYARSHVTLPQSYAELLAKTYTPASTVPVLNLSIFVSYLNESSVDVNMPMFKLVAKEGNRQFEWLGMTSNTHISSNSNNVSGAVAIEGVVFQKDKDTLTLHKADSDYDLHRTPMNLYLGNANVSFQSLVLMQDDKKALDMQQFDIHSSSDIQNGLFGSHVKITLGKLLSANKVYGPALLDVSLTNLDAEVLAKLNREANELQQGTDADRQKALLMLLPELPKLLDKGPRFEISDLSVTMPEGIIKGNLLISLPAEGTDNPFQLIQKIKGNGRFVFSDVVLKQLMNDAVKQSLQKQAAMQAEAVPVNAETPAPQATAVVPDSTATPAPEASAVVTDSTATPAPDTVAVVPVLSNALDPDAIAKEANEKLANMVQTGLLSIQGSNYVIEFKLADGKLIINDKPFDSAMMKF